MLTLWNQFDDLFSDELLKARRPLSRTFVPPVDIAETEEGYLLSADVPGMTAEELDITVEDGVLSVSGQRKAEASREANGYQRSERAFGAFRRTFVLPKGVNADAVTARVESGQLFVRIPKPVSALPRKVKVTPEALEGAAKAG